jgi:uncharacterized protein YecT (DUF1311 family)
MMDGAVPVRRVFVRHTIAGALTLVAAQAAQAASFDCRRATSSVEHAICGRIDLNELDNRLGALFQQAVSLQADRAPLLKQQRSWLSIRDKACAALGPGSLERCLSEQLNGRIGVLAAIVFQGSPPSDTKIVDAGPAWPKDSSGATAVAPPANPTLSIEAVAAPIPVTPQDDRVQVTTADKIYGSLDVFTSPRFLLTMAVVGLVFFGEARAKRTARSIPTKLGRLGLVLHWAALVVAVVCLGAAGLVLTQAKQANDVSVFVAMALGLAALLIWLVGKALRYILTGPMEPATDPQGPEQRR